MRRALGKRVDLRELGLTPDRFLSAAGAEICLYEEVRLAHEIRAVCALSDAYRQALALAIPQHLIDLVASHTPSPGSGS